MVKRVLIIILILLIAIPLVIAVLNVTGLMRTVMRLDRVVPNYRWCVGIVHKGILDYDYICSKYGEADSIETVAWDGRYTIFITHDMLCFQFGADNTEQLNDTSSWWLYTITTRNPKHYFGKDRIHVGSTRSEVIQAYSKATQIKSVELGDMYFDGFWDDSVEFTYDENDIVTSIEFVATM